ncbi:type I restriction enzyme endonuclease domain-containing protein [Iodobacter fluviatilis]|uniref:type I site-specific deoxyribonuclease n=1 Tax=Iodobacter fluviatilis TaxID=537 RepID=A0A7G3G605_9NEIS|nr:type I restriction enzyme endonuclease domain-containing protein [Iodobacter fluviatilis]QBC42890.1 hypothetical protein C1H71_04550 [Iodobacter fluviatilis]
MTEDQLEQEALSWLVETGYRHLCGYDIAPDGKDAERGDYVQPVLIERLRSAIARLNPLIPLVAREDAIKQVLDLGTPALLAANRHFHGLLVNGVPVQYQKDGETRGDFVRLIDFAEVSTNEFLAVNQYTLKGAKHTRRPDIILFVNGLPLVLLELKNPADENADIYKAFEQIQTYKAQIPDVFQYNEILVISDGSEARMGSLSANAERYMQWRTIDGISLDPLGQFNELETLIRGILAPEYLLDYLRFFVLLDDDFLAEVRNLPERNLAVELLERLLEGEIKSKFASNVVQQKKFSELLTDVVKRYQNRSIETAQVMEELVAMAKKFREAALRGESLGLSEDEVKFYDALANNESAVRELPDETLKRIAHELTTNLRKNISVDWSQRESVRAKLRIMVKRILRKYGYPPDFQEEAIQMVLQQAEALGAEWV